MLSPHRCSLRGGRRGPTFSSHITIITIVTIIIFITVITIITTVTSVTISATFLFGPAASSKC